MDLFKIYNSFKTEEDCHQYLIKLRWPEGVECVYCKSREIYKRHYGHRFKCRCCNKSFSVTAQTIFHSTKLPLRKWFLATAQILAAKKGISSLQLARTIKVNKNTAWLMQMRLKAAMKSDILLNGIVDVDEMVVARSMQDAKKREKDKHLFRSSLVHNNSVELKYAERKNIDSNIRGKLKSDYHKGTNRSGGSRGLNVYFKKQMKRHHRRYVRNEGIYKINGIEGYISMLKRAVIGQYHILSERHLQSYVEEIAFKKNNKDIKAFDLLLIKGCAIF